MGDAIAFQRVESFVEQKSVEIGVAGGIALEHRRQVGAHRLAESIIGGDGIVEHFADRQRTQIVAAQLARQMVGQRLLQPVMLQDGGMDETRQGGLAPGHGFGLLTQGGPDGIYGRDFFARAWHGRS
jgi:hypothetical protein